MPLHAFAIPPQPFTVSFPPEEISDLNHRLDRARWPKEDVVPDDGRIPAEAPGSFWMGHGPTLPLMKELATEWRHAYSWDKAAVVINSFQHYKVEIENLDIHFIHQRSEVPNAIPIILIHGWPGSFHEFINIIPLLANPPAGDQAFHVVVPSHPGYTFSSPPQSSKWVMDDTARVFDKLMTGLGYESYAAQGGDWGSITARCLGALHADHCKAVHLNFCPAPGPQLPKFLPPRLVLSWLPRWIVPDLARERALRALEYVEKGSAYYLMQHLTPRTPAYGLNDSPIGILAWIGEKMLPAILEASKSPNPTLTRECLYTTCTLYYLTSSIGTSFLPYTHNRHFSDFLTDTKYHLPKFAMSAFPNEIAVLPQAFVARTGNLVWYREAEEGGHFAAWEQPEVLAQHLRESIGLMWEGEK